MAGEEAKLSANSNKNGMELEDKDGGENEKFYEEIEAPKFVDFTLPDHYRPNDRYWFCLRVGCDQKHEEEMDAEAIYKNFVLRVMAARSPNVRLYKALNRNCSSKNTKCPLSAPQKSSKCRLSRLAITSPISEKKEKVKPLPKATPTPKAKGKQVASKYLTTPRNKSCIPNSNLNAFQSVQNQKLSSIAVPKNRTVAKTLIFHSPKKAISLKKSVELRTPLTKLCEGMKKLEITSQRKPVLGYSNKQSKQLGNNPRKSLPLHSSTIENGSNEEKCRTKVSKELLSRIDQDAKSLRSLKRKSKRKLSKHSSTKEISSARQIKARSRDDNKEHPVKESACPISNVKSTKLTSTDASKDHFNFSSYSAPTHMGGNDLPRLQISNKDDSIQEKLQEKSTIEVSLGNGEKLGNILSEEEVTSPGFQHESETAHINDKENCIKEVSLSNGEKLNNVLSKEVTAPGSGHECETAHNDKENGIIEVSLGNGVKLNNVLSKEVTSPGSGHENETAHNDDKENVLACDENRGCKHKKDHSGRKFLDVQNPDRKKVTEATNKELKGNEIIGAPGMKLMKLKSTNPKPFRLRTDERGILREANVEKKNHAVTPQKEAAVVSRFQCGDLHGQQKGTAALKSAKQLVRTKTPTGLRLPNSKQQESKLMTPTSKSKTSQESGFHAEKTKYSSRRLSASKVRP